MILVCGCLVTTISFTMMGVAHSAQAEMHVATAPMGTGIALPASD